MDPILYQAAAGMNASTRWQEIIADNLSAGQIPGFKKQDVAFSAVQAGFMVRAAGTSPSAAQRFTMPLAGTMTNFSAGELRPTGVATDLAVEGPGFFEVQMPDGSSSYTRDGEFRVNAKGQLTTKQGLPVMGRSGPIQLDVNDTAPMSVSATGEVSQGSLLKGRLKVSVFSDPSALTPTGTGLFIAGDPSIEPVTTAKPTVRQGVLEGGNASPLTEMGDLLTAMRLYEANQKVIQMEDDRVGRLISDVGNPAPGS